MGGGWHPDPTGRHGVRFHDGVRWTELVADGTVQGVDPVVPARKSWMEHASSRAALVIAPIVIALIGLGVALTLIVQAVADDGNTATGSETRPETTPAITLPLRLDSGSCRAILEALNASSVAFYNDNRGQWPMRLYELIPAYMRLREGSTVANETTMVGDGWVITMVAGGRVEPRFIGTDC